MKCLHFELINKRCSDNLNFLPTGKLGTRMTLCLLDISILLSEPFSSSFSPVYLFSLLYC